MALIMGIGDEVIHFAAAVVVMAVAALAWWSTNARPDRYRAVILRPFRYHPDTLTVRSGETPVTLQYTNTESGLETSRTGEPALESRESTDRDVVPLQEMDSIVDAHMALLDNNRLHFYRRVQSGRSVQLSSESTTDTETESTEDGEPASTAQIREMDSIVSAMEADETAGCELFSRTHGSESNSNTLITTPQKDKDKEEEPQSNSGESGVTDAAETSVQINEKKILIRLKYLNDTLKEVEGSLDEMLKDFKWRHLSRELRSSRVRLIFNGRVLGDDAATLRALGLHHRAVVHCLVHPRRTHSHINSSADSPVRTEAVGGEDAARARPALERAWDLESIFMTLVSVALTLIWFFRCEYSNLFTASASVALFGLTVFYSVAIFGLYLSDTFHFDRRLFRAAPRAAQE